MQIDERKRPYNSIYETWEPTEEEMEAYRMKRQRPDDPMASFLDSSNQLATDATQDRLCLYILLDSCCWLSMEKSVSILIKVRKQGDCPTLMKYPEVS